MSPFFLQWKTNKQFKLIRKLQKTYASDKDSLIEGTEEFDKKNFNRIETRNIFYENIRNRRIVI